MFVNKVVQDNFGNPLSFEVDQLKPNTYYVVHIKYSQINNPHTAIMFTDFERSGRVRYCDIFSGGYESQIIDKPKDSIYWFKIIRELPEMKEFVPIKAQ